MDGRFVAGVVLLVLPFRVFGAGDAAIDRATLRGLKAVNVVVDPLHPELEREGLSIGALQEQIESRLNKAGIKIDRDAPEFLALRVVAARGKKGPYTLSVVAGVYQPVLLVRNREVRTATQTWETWTLWITQPKVLLKSSLTAVAQLTNRFIDAYLSVNPQ
jgi:hypothetical protein